jgi:hypothetical protein
MAKISGAKARTRACHVLWVFIPPSYRTSLASPTATAMLTAPDNRDADQLRPQTELETAATGGNVGHAPILLDRTRKSHGGSLPTAGRGRLDSWPDRCHRGPVARKQGDSASVKRITSSPVVVLMSWCRLTTFTPVTSSIIAPMIGRAVSIK